MIRLASIVFLAALGIAGPAAGQSADQTADQIAGQITTTPSQDLERYEGYYHPPITSTEVFGRPRPNAPEANRAVRVTFVTQLTKAMMDAPDTPPYALFAKGGEADTLILVGLDDQMFKTLYRARAVLAQLTSNARGTEFFVRSEQQTTATFFDLLVLLGFKRLVVTDGAVWAHQVNFEANQQVR